MDGLTELAEKIDAAGTRAEFARKVGIGEPYLSKILSGKRPFCRLPIQTGAKIGEAAGIPLERLTAGINPAQRKRARR
jgi:transcriptional regulator with XRE-family HTH domain